ncbi:GNAT family N-acetyltransferase [Actinomadura verrucosospora]|uniref:GCN5-like N-acetyltransferase n=1 Tax=Actinomadura verrucosospora TaxID=46165 RepID=A0A7D4A2U0_ACTVE|nr:GNAT family protein [Actinomadura verrucosospora]QKG27226.1 GCN5-like N-acetyltransferase [Actinomadura verrucosospora]
MDLDALTLRPVRKDDLPFLRGFLADPETAGEFAWHGYGDPHRWERRWAEDGLLSDDSSLMMVASGDARLGFVGWSKVIASRVTHYYNFGIGLHPDYRGNGIGTEAQRRLIRYLFDYSQVHRLEADTELGNIAEQRTLEKLGLTREGVMRAVVFRDGAWRDGVRYSLLRTDPRP